MTQRIPFALVHHANQYLITNGYENREGVSNVLDRLSSFLELHERFRIPFNLHISGTLIEAILWYRPRFLNQVKRLREAGIVKLVGGSYGQNIMPLSSPEHNRRQLRELLSVYERHLDCPPETVKVCWIPERVWSTEALASALTDGGLPNGGYRAVLLDDRLLYDIGRAYEGSSRQRFDATGPADVLPWPDGEAEGWDPESVCAIAIESGKGLVAIPFSAGVRYAIPPSREGHWSFLSSFVARLREHGRPNSILVFADDVEKSAGIGSWDARGPAQYRALLKWLVKHEGLRPVFLDEWLGELPEKMPQRPIDDGTFYELDRQWGASNDYRGWWDSDAWRPHRGYLETSEAALADAEDAGADKRLLELGWKHLLASSYESGWFAETGGSIGPAPWSQALASHARASIVIAEAAKWQHDVDAAPDVRRLDVDADGEEEFVLTNDQISAVVSPKHGGRLVYLFERGNDGGRLMVGNPTDDWNWQQELNRYMDQPPNHPGAFADVGFEHNAYEIDDVSCDSDSAVARLRNTTPTSPLTRSSKTFALMAGESILVVCYQLVGLRFLSTEFCLSPDYLNLLRDGSRNVRALRGPTWRGWRHDNARVWVALVDAEQTQWDKPKQRRVGHGLALRVTAQTPHFHVVLGLGRVSRAKMNRAIDSLHSVR